MSSRKLQKEIESTFKKINEGLESFNYHYDRIQDLNNQVLDRNLESQKEKLETDLKREIKKLQKNRELIKNWQSNDTIDVVVSRAKLQEHRKLVEEAMEKYKEVEKSSKMKTFSNQSIMMASLEQEDLTPESIEIIEFLESCKETLQDQIENLDQEYERISSKKTKKNSSLESEKQEIEAFLSVDRFHLGKFEEIIDFLKMNQINPELVEKIRDDISFIVESNQDPDFVDDETLYDEIFIQGESNYKYKPQESTIEEILETNEDDIEPVKDVKESSKEPKDRESSKEPEIQPLKEVINTPKKDLDKDKELFSSPDIIHKLKPASPGKSVAWSSIAAQFSQPEEKSPSREPSREASKEPSKEITSSLETTPTPSAQPELDENTTKSIDVIKSSQLPELETKLFTDTTLVKVPPGLQQFIISFAASQSTETGLLKSLNKAGDPTKETETSSSRGSQITNPNVYNSICPLITKKYLPTNFKPPLNFTNYCSNWNQLRASNGLDDFKQQFSLLTEEAKINDQLYTLFYGFYYGITPLENLLAENHLNELGWFPYNLKSGEKYNYWFKKVEENYQIFDLSTWEIVVKFGYKLDFNLLEMGPLKRIN